MKDQDHVGDIGDEEGSDIGHDEQMIFFWYIQELQELPRVSTMNWLCEWQLLGVPPEENGRLCLDGPALPR